MKKHRDSFTMIEMLVTILIIFILMGIVFRLMPRLDSAEKKATSVTELQKIRMALNEYYKEYGGYPPVNFMEYEYENSSLGYQTVYFRDTFLPNHDYPASNDFFADVAERMGSGVKGTNWFLGYRYGLVSYLYKRDRGSQKHWYDRDTDRDVRAKEKWAAFIAGIGPDSKKDHPYPTPQGDIGAQAPYSNSVASLIDPYGVEYRYRSVPPYTRFKLWSAGPDKTDGTEDDIDSAEEE